MKIFRIAKDKKLPGDTANHSVLRAFLIPLPARRGCSATGGSAQAVQKRGGQQPERRGPWAGASGPPGRQRAKQGRPATERPAGRPPGRIGGCAAPSRPGNRPASRGRRHGQLGGGIGAPVAPVRAPPTKLSTVMSAPSRALRGRAAVWSPEQRAARAGRARPACIKGVVPGCRPAKSSALSSSSALAGKRPSSRRKRCGRAASPCGTTGS